MVYNNFTQNKQRGERSLSTLQMVLLVMFLLLFGILMVFSASAILAYTDPRIRDTFYYLKRQIGWIVVGTVIAFFLYKIKLSTIKKYAVGYFLIVTGMMFYLIPEALFNAKFPFVVTKNGATRWLTVGIFEIQPAEFMKIGIILLMATWFTMDKSQISKIKQQIKLFLRKRKWEISEGFNELIYHFIPIFIAGLICAIIIVFQKDLDTGATIFVIFLSIYFVSSETKLQTKITIFVLIASIMMGLFAISLQDYRKARLETFVNILVNGEPSREQKQGESFQVWNGLVAIGTGGLTGVGYNGSRQKLFFLQEAAYTDSIFAVIAEEFGLLGSLIVIFSFLYFLAIGLNISKNANNKFGYYIAIGVTSWVVLQAFLNIAANLAVIPFGGMPLPFFTYGGSNTIMTIAGVGLLLNVNKGESENSVRSKRIPERRSRR